MGTEVDLLYLPYNIYTMQNTTHTKMERIPGKYYNLELGSQYIVSFVNGGAYQCRFIQTSPKGFNFLNEETNKCIYPHARGAKGYGGIEIPKDEKHFTVFFTRYTYNIRKIGQ